MSLERIWKMVIKEFIQVFRDPRMKALIFILPALQALVFGYAITLDVKNIKLAILDLTETEESREIANTFLESGYFIPSGHLSHSSEIEKVLGNGRARVVLHIDPLFTQKLQTNKPAAIQLLIDGSDANSAAIIQSYLSKGIDQLNIRWGSPPSVKLEERAWFNTNLESRPYYVPGVLAILLTLITLTLTSMAIVREKEIGTIEQLMVTPITPGEFILGKTVPFIFIGLIDVCAILIVAVYWFEIPLRGSLALLFSSIFAYACTTLGAGLIISTLCSTQQQAMMSAFLVYFPTVLLSGFIFPIANMPLIIQWITLLNPLRHFLVIIRSIFLKGIGLEFLWPQVAALFIMGIVILFTAIRRFHKMGAT